MEGLKILDSIKRFVKIKHLQLALFSVLTLSSCDSNKEENTIGDINQSPIEIKHDVDINITDSLALELLDNDKYEDALQQFLIALKYYEESDDKEGILLTYNNIGKIHYRQEEYMDALEFFNKSLSLAQDINHQTGMMKNHNNMGSTYFYQDSLESSNLSYNNALNVFKSSTVHDIESIKNIIRTYEGLGWVSYQKKDFDQCKRYRDIALGYCNQINDNEGAIAIALNIADLKYTKGDISGALKDFLSLESEVKKLGMKRHEMNIYYSISYLYQKVGNYKKAIEYKGKEMTIKDEIRNIASNQAQEEMQVKYETEKKDQELKTQKIELGAQADKLKSEKLKKIILATSSFVFAVLGFGLFRSRKKIKKKNVEIEKEKEEADNQRSIAEGALETAENQTQIAEKATNEIQSSIKYAKRIQMAILPIDEEMKKIFPDNFILFKPRDIVSGDFYWAKEIDGKKLFAQIDCTGHGVPGAFVSLVGHNGLENAVNAGNKTPADILNYLDKHLATQLVKEENREGIKDGMDMFLYSYDTKTGKLTYAGNKSEMLLIPDNQNFVMKNKKNRGKKIELKSENNKPVIGYTIRGINTNFGVNDEDLKEKSNHTETWSVKSLDNKGNKDNIVLTDYKKGIDKNIERTKLNQLYNNVVSYKNDEGKMVEGEVVFNTKDKEVARKGWIMIKGKNGNIFGMPKKNLQKKDELSINFFAVGSKISYINNTGNKIEGEIIKHNGNIISIKILDGNITTISKQTLHKNKYLNIDHTKNYDFLKYKSIIGDTQKIDFKPKFENTTIEIDGLTLYLYSDGYFDQFGKHKENQKETRKFLVRHFRKLLMEITHKPLDKQKIILENMLKKFQGTEEQTDDISVSAMRLEKDKISQS